MGERGKVTLNGIDANLIDNKLVSNNSTLNEFDEITIDSEKKEIYHNRIELSPIELKRSDAVSTDLSIKIIASKISNYEDTMKLFDKKPKGCGL